VPQRQLEIGKGSTFRRIIGVMTLAVMLLAANTGLAVVDTPCDDSFTPVPPQVLNPSFNVSFDLAVDWNWMEAGHAWNLDSLQRFALAIMDENPSGGHDLIDRLVAYFSEDLDPSPAGIEVAQESGTYSRFHICLREAVGDIYSAGNKVELACVVQVAPGIDQVVSARHLAAESFAHEWQHITFNRVAAGPKFGGLTGTNEFFSKCAEFLAGWDRMWPVHDNPYERSIMGSQDWFAECVHPDHGEHKYATFGLFGAHLMEQFIGNPRIYEDDLLYRWLNSEEEDIFGNKLWRISPSTLAGLLSDPTYDDRFDAEDGSDRLEELFHEFALSLWVNAPMEDQGDATVWAGGRLPQDHYQLFRNVNEIDCADDARSLPLFLTVGSDAQSVRGPVYPSDVHRDDPSACTSGFDSLEFPRYPHLSTYGFTVLPFTADPDLTEEKCKDFRFTLTMENTIFCPTAGGDIDVLPSPNQRLNLSVIGYPEAVDQLDIHGDEAVEISRAQYSLDVLPQEIAISVPCFGNRWRSLALVLSVTESMPSNGFVWSRIFPFRYEAWAEVVPSPILVEEPETWGGPGEVICLDRSLMVAESGELEVAAGTEIMAVAPIEIRVAGQLTLQGEQGAEVVVGSADPSNEPWGAIELLDGGELTVNHARIDRIGRFQSDPGSSLRLEDCSWDAGLFSDPFLLDGQDVSIERTHFTNSYGLHLATGRFEGGSVRAGFKHEGPLLVLGEGARECRELLIEDSLEGIRVVGGDVSLEDVTIRMAEHSARTLLGIEVTSGARLTAEDVKVLGYHTGIKVKDQCYLFLRNSTFEGFGVGVEILGGAHLVDLGNGSFGDDSWGQNDFFPIPSADSRGIVNRGGVECLAQWNYWGDNHPQGSFFDGPVAWEPYGVVPYETSTPPGDPFTIALEESVPGLAPVRIESAWPNPFNPTVRFRFHVEGPSRLLTLTIYDVLGRRRAVAFSERFEAGAHERSWDAEDEFGRTLGSGVYFARFDESSDGLKLLLLK